MNQNASLAAPARASALVLAALLGHAGTALADTSGTPDNALRVGLYSVNFRATAADLSGPFTPPGIHIEVQHLVTPYLAYLRRLNAQWDIEVSGGIPPTTHTLARGPATVGSVPLDGQQVATAKWFSPAVLLEYKFLDEGSIWRPYVGLGINFTRFYDRISTAAGDAVNGGPTRISLSNSIGPVATVGVLYRFTREIHATASYSLAQVNSSYVSDTSGVTRRTDVHFNPRIFVAALGYAF